MPRLSSLLPRLARRLCVLWLLAICLGTAQAQDHITERAWLEDPTGTLRLEDVVRLPARPFSGTLSRGFGDAVVWLRLRIDPHKFTAPGSTPQPLVLRVRPVYLDDIQVFDPLAADGVVARLGDHHHPRQDTLQGLDFLMPLEAGSSPRDIWLRLASTSTRQIDVQAVSLHELNRIAHTQTLLYACYIGLILVLAVWGLVYWLFSREPIIGAFGLKQAAALLYALGSLGYLRALWPEGWPAALLDQALTVFSITAVSAAVWFHTVLQREFGPPAWLHRLHLAMCGLLLVKLGMLLSGATVAALRLNMFEVLLVPPAFLGSVLLARGWSAPPDQRPALSRPVAIGFYGVMVLLMLMAALPGLGLVGGGEIALHVVQAHGLFTAFWVLLMLQYRAHVVQQRQRATALALERSEIQAQQERGVRQEQENLLAMLAHELKTPLATMHLRLDSQAAGSREIKQAIRDMNGVIERCLQTAKLSDRQLVAHVEASDASSLVQEAVASCAEPARVQLQTPDRLAVQTDPQLLFLVLNNLLENACKYAAPDSPIEVRLAPAPADGRPEALRLEIANRPGPAGWPEADKVFDKYYRSPHARRQAGTGLGLFLVRKLMQTLGGQIDYAPTDSHVRFVLRLPLHAKPA